MTAVVVERYEQRYGFEENKFFGLFTSMQAWETYCQRKGITISRPDGEYRNKTHYNDDTYTYNAKEVSFIE